MYSCVCIYIYIYIYISNYIVLYIYIYCFEINIMFHMVARACLASERVISSGAWGDFPCPVMHFIF